MFAKDATIVRRMKNVVAKLVAVCLTASLILSLAFVAPISAKRWHAHRQHHAYRLHVGSATWWRWMDRAGRGGRQQP
jgi:hypothetical protein